eukprot:g836.t1
MGNSQIIGQEHEGVEVTVKSLYNYINDLEMAALRLRTFKKIEKMLQKRDESEVLRHSMGMVWEDERGTRGEPSDAAKKWMDKRALEMQSQWVHEIDDGQIQGLHGSADRISNKQRLAAEDAKVEEELKKMKDEANKKDDKENGEEESKGEVDDREEEDEEKKDEEEKKEEKEVEADASLLSGGGDDKDDPNFDLKSVIHLVAARAYALGYDVPEGEGGQRDIEKLRKLADNFSVQYIGCPLKYEGANWIETLQEWVCCPRDLLGEVWRHLDISFQDFEDNCNKELLKENTTLNVQKAADKVEKQEHLEVEVEEEMVRMKPMKFDDDDDDDVVSDVKHSDTVEVKDDNQGKKKNAVDMTAFDKDIDGDDNKDSDDESPDKEKNNATQGDEKQGNKTDSKSELKVSNNTTATHTDDDVESSEISTSSEEDPSSDEDITLSSTDEEHSDS